MQKVEIILNGPEEERCAELIRDLAHEAIQHYDVVPVRTYCGRDPARKGFGELLVPEFMRCGTAAASARKRPAGVGRKAVPHEG